MRKLGPWVPLLCICQIRISSLRWSWRKGSSGCQNVLRAGDFCQAPGSGLEPGAGSFSSWFLALDSSGLMPVFQSIKQRHSSAVLWSKESQEEPKTRGRSWGSRYRTPSTCVWEAAEHWSLITFLRESASLGWLLTALLPSSTYAASAT